MCTPHFCLLPLFFVTLSYVWTNHYFVYVRIKHDACIHVHYIYISGLHSLTPFMPGAPKKIKINLYSLLSFLTPPLLRTSSLYHPPILVYHMSVPPILSQSLKPLVYPTRWSSCSTMSAYFHCISQLSIHFPVCFHFVINDSVSVTASCQYQCHATRVNVNVCRYAACHRSTTHHALLLPYEFWRHHKKNICAHAAWFIYIYYDQNIMIKYSTHM